MSSGCGLAMLRGGNLTVDGTKLREVMEIEMEMEMDEQEGREALRALIRIREIRSQFGKLHSYSCLTVAGLSHIWLGWLKSHL
jgi:hypothetical protein